MHDVSLLFSLIHAMIPRRKRGMFMFVEKMNQTITLLEDVTTEKEVTYVGDDISRFFQKNRTKDLIPFQKSCDAMKSFTKKEITKDTQVYEGVYSFNQGKQIRLFFVKHRNECYYVMETKTNESQKYMIWTPMNPLFFVQKKNDKEYMIPFNTSVIQPKEKPYQNKAIYELIQKEEQVYEMFENKKQLNFGEIQKIMSELYMELFAVHRRLETLVQGNPQKKKIKK